MFIISSWLTKITEISKHLEGFEPIQLIGKSQPWTVYWIEKKT